MELDIKRVSKSPVHTAEHILNRTMVNMFGCPRSRNAHIERKKSKCDYMLAECPTDDQVKAIEAKVNEVIAAALPVTTEYISREEAASSDTASMNGYGQLYKFRLLTFPTIRQPIA